MASLALLRRWSSRVFLCPPSSSHVACSNSILHPPGDTEAGPPCWVLGGWLLSSTPFLRAQRLQGQLQRGRRDSSLPCSLVTPPALRCPLPSSIHFPISPILPSASPMRLFYGLTSRLFIKHTGPESCASSDQARRVVWICINGANMTDAITGRALGADNADLLAPSPSPQPSPLGGLSPAAPHGKRGGVRHYYMLL